MNCIENVGLSPKSTTKSSRSSSKLFLPPKTAQNKQTLVSCGAATNWPLPLGHAGRGPLVSTRDDLPPMVADGQPTGSAGAAERGNGHVDAHHNRALEFIWIYLY
jgi:hypothetical protein